MPAPPRTVDLVWLLAMALAAGAVAVLVRADDPAALILRNEGAPPGALGTLLAGALVVFGLAALVVWRRREGLAAGLASAARHGRWLVGLPLLAVFAVDPSGLAGALAPALALACAGLAAAAAYAWDMSSGTWPRARRLLAAPRLPAALLAAAFAGAWARLAGLALVRHDALASRVYDLGIYDNALWRTIHGEVLATEFVPGGHHFDVHVDPILALLAPIYALRPGPEVLLVVQAGWLLAGAFPLYRLARRRLGSAWIALVLALAYLLYPSVHGAALFDFHSFALAAPLVIWAIDLAERGATRRFAVAAALLLACREDVALLVCGIGLWLALGLGRRRLGLATIAGALAWFAATQLLVQTGDLPYARRYRDLLPGGEGGFGDVARTLLVNPGFALLQVLTARKLVYLVTVLAPLLALPLLGGALWWTFGFGLAFTLLATNPLNFSALSHHAVALFPALFAAAPAGLERASVLIERLGGSAPRARRALAVGVLVAAAMLSWRFGALVVTDAYRGEPHVAPAGLDDAARARLAWVERVAAAIPAGATLGVTNHVGAHFAARDRVFLYPDPARRGVEALALEYLVFDRRDFRDRGDAELRGLERRGFQVLDRHGDALYFLRRAP